jgi:hypothetical protein
MGKTRNRLLTAAARRDLRQAEAIFDVAPWIWLDSSSLVEVIGEVADRQQGDPLEKRS